MARGLLPICYRPLNPLKPKVAQDPRPWRLDASHHFAQIHIGDVHFPCQTTLAAVADQGLQHFNWVHGADCTAHAQDLQIFMTRTRLARMDAKHPDLFPAELAAAQAELAAAAPYEPHCVLEDEFYDDGEDVPEELWRPWQEEYADAVCVPRHGAL